MINVEDHHAAHCRMARKVIIFYENVKENTHTYMSYEYDIEDFVKTHRGNLCVIYQKYTLHKCVCQSFRSDW